MSDTELYRNGSLTLFANLHSPLNDSASELLPKSVQTSAHIDRRREAVARGADFTDPRAERAAIPAGGHRSRGPPLPPRTRRPSGGPSTGRFPLHRVRDAPPRIPSRRRTSALGASRCPPSSQGGRLHGGERRLAGEPYMPSSR